MLDKQTDPLSVSSQSDDQQAPKKVFADTGLSVLEVCGKDAAKLLQGQVTCNINDLSNHQASIAAFCNAKGRVISTLLIVKSLESYFILLPSDLIEIVLKKLRMYVLRADVQLFDRTGHMGVMGLNTFPGLSPGVEPPSNYFEIALLPMLTIKLPGAGRYLVMGGISEIAEFSQTLIASNGYLVSTLDEWRHQDITTALPWFSVSQTEQHIPQMLGIDQLGGVSFNKGCYTGQEIVARSHYLGKVKRALFVAECQPLASNDINGCRVLDPKTEQSLGAVLTNTTWQETSHLLLVLQIVDGQLKNLILDDEYRTPVTVISDL